MQALLTKRTGLGLIQADMVNAHLALMYRTIPDAQKQQYPQLKEVVLDRETVIARLMQELGGKRWQIKKLILAMAYGGSVTKQLAEILHYHGPPPQWLIGFRTCIESWAKVVAEANPGRLAALQDLGKDRPHISLLSYLLLDEQRSMVDYMAGVVRKPAKVVSYERDGVVYHGSVDTSVLKAAASVPITLEPYPDEREILQELEENYPFVNFKTQSKFHFTEVVRARAACCRVVFGITDDKGELKFPTPDNTTDFGLLVAARLEPFVLCGRKSTMEFYDRSLPFGMWQTLMDREKVIQLLVRDVLLDEFRGCKVSYVDGKVQLKHTGPPAKCCKRRGFYTAVAGDTALSLMRTAPALFLDHKDTRRFLQDAAGRIYDYETDKIYVHEPGIRVQRHLPWTFFEGTRLDEPDAVWAVPRMVKQRVSEYLQEVFAYWLQEPRTEKSVEDYIMLQAKTASFKTFVLKCEHTKVWQLFLPMFESMDMTLWRLLHFAADSCAWRRRVEFQYFQGVGGSGKDTSHLLSLTYFGDRSAGGYATVIPKDYFLGRSKRSDLDTVLDDCKHMRYMGCNEISEHDFIDVELMKTLSEQRGAGIVSRTIYEKPDRWLPMGGLYLSGNHPLKLSQNQAEDSGVARRLNYFRFQKTFTGNSGDIDIKDVIESGDFNQELFWLTRAFYSYLSKCPAGETRLLPRPRMLCEETGKLLDQDALAPLRDWLDNTARPASNYTEAAPAVKVKEQIEKDLRISQSVLKDMLEAVGLKERTNGSKRVLTYTFPGQPRARAIRLAE